MPDSDAPTDWWKTFINELPARTAKLAVVRKDGRPFVAPVWAEVDGDDVVFLTSADTIKGKAILRDPRVSLCWDDEKPPFSFVTIHGTATTSTNPDELLAFATSTAARFMGADQADAYGRPQILRPLIYAAQFRRRPGKRADQRTHLAATCKK